MRRQLRTRPPVAEQHMFGQFGKCVRVVGLLRLRSVHGWGHDVFPSDWLIDGAKLSIRDNAEYQI